MDVEIDISDNSSFKEEDGSVILNQQEKQRPQTCHECGKRQGYYRAVTNNVLCRKCKASAKHKLITKTTAMKTYNLSSSDLYHAYKQGCVECFSMPNPYGARNPPMRLYFEHEIVELATRMHKKMKQKEEESSVEFDVEYF